jgi:hypothetical protein
MPFIDYAHLFVDCVISSTDFDNTYDGYTNKSTDYVNTLDDFANTFVNLA